MHCNKMKLAQVSMAALSCIALTSASVQHRGSMMQINKHKFELVPIDT